ncbi:MAG TPA: hypothetical protein VEI02_16900, partial [Planctomycetota bacterium]|nr:hypothetical protein [Planctomycetota bacterium]
MIVCTLDPDDAAAATRALAAFASVARLASQVIVESEHDRAALVRLLVAAGLDDVARRTTTRPPVVVGDPPQEDLASRRGREDAGALAALADDGARR